MHPDATPRSLEEDQPAEEPAGAAYSSDDLERALDALSDSSAEVPLRTATAGRKPAASKPRVRKAKASPERRGRAAASADEDAVADDTDADARARDPDELFREVLTSEDIYLRLLRYEVRAARAGPRAGSYPSRMS